jgi:hypothetical protein
MTRALMLAMPPSWLPQRIDDFSFTSAWEERRRPLMTRLIL